MLWVRLDVCTSIKRLYQVRYLFCENVYYSTHVTFWRNVTTWKENFSMLLRKTDIYGMRMVSSYVLLYQILGWVTPFVPIKYLKWHYAISYLAASIPGCLRNWNILTFWRLYSDTPPLHYASSSRRQSSVSCCSSPPQALSCSAKQKHVKNYPSIFLYFCMRENYCHCTQENVRDVSHK
jgi:hypothetical protein